MARRTEAIKTIVDNVTFGFLVVNRELIVQPECTKSCMRLFGTSKVEGANLCDLLGLADRARLSFVLGIDQVFEDVLPTEASIAQMRRKFPMKDERVLQIDAGAVRNHAGEMTSLLLTISDITALEAATRESNNNRTLVSILKQRGIVLGPSSSTQSNNSRRLAVQSGRVIRRSRGTPCTPSKATPLRMAWRISSRPSTRSKTWWSSALLPRSSTRRLRSPHSSSPMSECWTSSSTRWVTRTSRSAVSR